MLWHIVAESTLCYVIHQAITHACNSTWELGGVIGHFQSMTCSTHRKTGNVCVLLDRFAGLTTVLQHRIELSGVHLMLCMKKGEQADVVGA